MKQISEKCMMVLVCLMLSGCGSESRMYLEQADEETSVTEMSGMERSGSEMSGAGQKDAGQTPDGKSENPQVEGGQETPELSEEETGAGGSGTSHGDKSSSGRVIAVYVCGEVKVPGVYELTEGMRICDAIEAAGGFTKKAGREYWNLAQPLTDGQMLCVPTEEEAKKREAAAEGQQSSSAAVGQQNSSAAGGQWASDSDAQDTKALVNINTADATLLTSVPGIGQVRAEAVIAYRREHGDFQRTEDIKKVSGIGDALFEKMKDYITVS